MFSLTAGRVKRIRERKRNDRQPTESSRIALSRSIRCSSSRTAWPRGEASVGVLVEQQARVVLGDAHQVGLGLEVGDAEARQARLLHAEQVAGAAQRAGPPRR